MEPGRPSQSHVPWTSSYPVPSMLSGYVLFICSFYQIVSLQRGLQHTACLPELTCNLSPTLVISCPYAILRIVPCFYPQLALLTSTPWPQSPVLHYPCPLTAHCSPTHQSTDPGLCSCPPCPVCIASPHASPLSPRGLSSPSRGALLGALAHKALYPP